MKYSYTKTSLLVLFFTILSYACSDDTLDKIDKNPNQPPEVGLNSLLAQSTATLVTTISGADLSLYTTVVSEQSAGTFTLVQDADRGNTDYQEFIGTWWSNAYAGLLQDAKVIIDQGIREENYIHVAIAKIYYAYTIGILTDMFGRVPESEALSGSTNRFPVYDSQEAIYHKMQTLLSEAVVHLEQGGANPGSADLFFGGDIEQWKMTAWGLKARYYNRLSNIDPDGSASAALDAVEKSFASYDQGWIFDKFENSSTGQNIWSNSVYTSYVALGETLYDLMQAEDDPRLDHFFTKVDGEVVPAPNGAAKSDPDGAFYSKPSPAYLTAVTPMPLLTYDELKFIEAEAHLRLERPDEANDAFENAVTAALKRVGIGDSEVENFTNSMFPGAAELRLQDIIAQKYISFWLFQSIEAYNEVRRTGFPAMRKTLNASPERLPYPNSELSSNFQNVPKVQLSDGVWWADGTED